MNLNPNDDTASQFKNEVMAVIYRYSQESELTVYELIGALEVCKHAVLTMHQQSPND
jgi:hypothetical protein